MSMIKGIEHIGICAEDTSSLKDWYVKLFGFKVVYENNKTPKSYILYINDGSMIEIYPASEDSKISSNKIKGIRHIALIADNFEEMCETLKDNCVEIIEEAKVSASGVKTIFFRDIENNVLHLIDRPNPLAP
ncbi:MAG TPA: VOC family protein [Clostridia bacterium]|nr:VOC family protein [Clostridia bacterium]